jgi:hypothetical protein
MRLKLIKRIVSGFLNSSGYVFLGNYENGPFQFSARNQYIRYNNQYYRLNAATDVGFILPAPMQSALLTTLLTLF